MRERTESKSFGAKPPSGYKSAKIPIPDSASESINLELGSNSLIGDIELASDGKLYAWTGEKWLYQGTPEGELV